MDENDEIFEAIEAVEMFLAYARRVKPDYELLVLHAGGHSLPRDWVAIALDWFEHLGR